MPQDPSTIGTNQWRFYLQHEDHFGENNWLRRLYDMQSLFSNIPLPMEYALQEIKQWSLENPEHMVIAIISSNIDIIFR